MAKEEQIGKSSLLVLQFMLNIFYFIFLKKQNWKKRCKISCNLGLKFWRHIINLRWIYQGRVCNCLWRLNSTVRREKRLKSFLRQFTWELPNSAVSIQRKCKYNLLWPLTTKIWNEKRYVAISPQKVIKNGRI